MINEDLFVVKKVVYFIEKLDIVLKIKLEGLKSVEVRFIKDLGKLNLNLNTIDPYVDICYFLKFI